MAAGKDEHPLMSPGAASSSGGTSDRGPTIGRAKASHSASRWTKLLSHKGALIKQIICLGICFIALFLGNSKIVKTHQDALIANPTLVSLALGLSVQVALIPPIELARRIAQGAFWSRLTGKGMSYRQMVSTWSLLYSNSYRGAEDVIKGFTSISAMLLVVFFGEILVLGSVGSLYDSTPYNQLSASGYLPMHLPLQLAVTSEVEAGAATDLAAKVMLHLGTLYDPLTLQGLTMSNQTSLQFGDGIGARSTVLASPLTVPSLDILGRPISEDIPWASVLVGDHVKTRATAITATSSCEVTANLTYGDLLDAPALNIDIGGTVYWSPFNSWVLQNYAFVHSPQVDLYVFSSLDVNDPNFENVFEPLLDDEGRIYVAAQALNFADNADYMNSSYDGVPLGLALCRIGIGLSTVQAEFEIVNVEPTRLVKLVSFDDQTEHKHYSMSNDTEFGYSAAQFLFSSLFPYTCDFFSCPYDADEIPYYTLLLGLIKTPAAAGDTFTTSLETTAVALARVGALLMSTFTAAPTVNIPTGNSSFTPTYTEIWSTNDSLVIEITAACNGILGLGAACGLLLFAFHLIAIFSKRFWYLIGGNALTATESLVGLMASMPKASKMPHLHSQADISELRDASNFIVRAHVDRETGRVKMTFVMPTGASEEAPGSGKKMLPSPSMNHEIMRTVMQEDVGEHDRHDDAEV
ncbi:hypothetical protein HKX48_005329 [Thoreauomyces humboldtii]|nr:hypothetical protein HKX48_005329 [Thoreauomyces humboldtii]